MYLIWKLKIRQISRFYGYWLYVAIDLRLEEFPYELIGLFVRHVAGTAIQLLQSLPVTQKSWQEPQRLLITLAIIDNGVHGHYKSLENVLEVLIYSP